VHPHRDRQGRVRHRRGDANGAGLADVHAFPGHIACDAASRSELVVPLLRGDTLLGVLDLDSPVPDRFDDVDRAGIEAVAAIWVATSH
jgi:L-methionine (R)-S-oxide reductase